MQRSCSMIRRRVQSYKPPEIRTRKEPRRGFARHFEGWQPGLVAVLIAGLVAALVVPRPVEPRDVPSPAIDRIALSRTAAADDARARSARVDGLDVDVRRLGTALHEYGRADCDGSEDALVASRAKVVDAGRAAFAVGEEAVLRLRAFQLVTFLDEVRAWEHTGRITDSLCELGGGFSRLLERNAWVVTEDGRPRVLLDDAALRASFKKRWNEIVGVGSSSFALSLDEQRSLFRFLLVHPTMPSSKPEPGHEESPAWRAFEEGHAAQFQLKKIEELSALDATYPRDFARGVVLYRLQRFALAVESFRRHLEDHPDGPLSLRAQNHLRAALGRAYDEPF